MKKEFGVVEGLAHTYGHQQTEIQSVRIIISVIKNKSVPLREKSMSATTCCQITALSRGCSTHFAVLPTCVHLYADLKQFNIFSLDFWLNWLA